MNIVLKFGLFFLLIGCLQPSWSYAQKITVDGKEHQASAPCEGNNFSITAGDGSYMVIVLNSPDAGDANVDDKVMTEGCGDCPFIQVMSLTEGKEYYSKSGTMSHQGNQIKFDVKVYAPDTPDKLIPITGDVTCQ